MANQTEAFRPPMASSQYHSGVGTTESRELVFYAVFFLVFCFSGLLTVLGILTGVEYYRMGLVSLLVIPLLFVYGIKPDRVVSAYWALAVVIFLSGLFNQSSVMDIVLFLRILVFSYLMHRLTEVYVTPETITRIVKWCVAIAVVQLPLVLLQQRFYHLLPFAVRRQVSSIDIGFGSFNFKGDAAMAFFLILIVIFLLFDTQRNYVVRYRWPVALWLTLTVLVTRAQLPKLIVLIIWGTYLVARFRPKTIVYVALALMLLAGVLHSAGVLETTWRRLAGAIRGNTSTALAAQSRFEQGGYARGAAIAYYLDKGVSLLGDGPSAYYDPIERVRVRGNTGHIFTFYSEVGLFGWLLSVWILWLIALPQEQNSPRFIWSNLLCFGAIQLLTLTQQTMNDISIMLAYCIFTKTYLIPERSVRSTETW